MDREGGRRAGNNRNQFRNIDRRCGDGTGGREID